MYIGQPVAPSLEFKIEPFMINAQQMHQGGLKVMNMNWIFYYVITKIIGLLDVSKK